MGTPPDDDDQRNNAGSENRSAPSDPLLERVPTVCKRITRCGDCDAPDHGTGRVVEDENRPAQPARTGENGTDHAKPGDEARDEDRLGTVPLEKAIELRQPRRCHAEATAVPLGETAATIASDVE